MLQANPALFARLLAAASFIAVSVATLWPLPGAPPSGSSLCIACGELGGVDLVLNVALFLPLGLALAMGWPGRRWIWVVPPLLSLGIEVMQLRIIPGRDASLGDLVANTTGGLLGLAVASVIPALLRSATGRSLATAASALLIVAFSSLVAWGLLPARVRYLEWVQIQPDRAGYAHFTGNVSVSLFDTPRRVGTIIQPHEEPAEYRRGDLEARVIITDHQKANPPVEALIFRLANHNEMLVQISQRDDALAVRFRKRGSLLRLRSPTFVLGGVFPQSADSMVVTARSERSVARLSASSTSGEYSLDAAVTLGRGWELFSPFRAVKPASEQMLRWSFLALLLGIPAVFSWIAWRRRGLLIAALTTSVALAAIPAIAGLATSSADEWMAAAIGMTAGAAAGALATRLLGPPHEQKT